MEWNFKIEPPVLTQQKDYYSLKQIVLEMHAKRYAVPLYFTAFSGLIFFLSIFVLSVNAQMDSTDFKIFKSTEFGVSIKYPANWQAPTGGIPEQMPNPNVTVISHFSPPEQSVSVFLTVEKLAPNTTLVEDMNDTVKKLRKDMPDFKILESGQTKLAGLPAYRLTGEGQTSLRDLGERLGLANQTSELLSVMKILGLNGITLKQTAISTIKNGTLYSVAYGSVSDLFPGQYSAYLPVFQEMASSYKIEPLESQVATNSLNNNQSNSNPCAILKIRLANGNISISEFEKLNKILGCG